MTTLQPTLQQQLDLLAENMLFIEGGSFMMGSEEGYKTEKPVHKVTVPNSYLGKYPVTQELWQAVMGENPSYFKGSNRPVTQELWQAVMGENPSYFKGSNRPVEQVSWNDTQKFLRRLYGITGERYRLPTEAEWEYAARGGKNTRISGQSRGAASAGLKYAGSHKLKNVGWYEDNSHGETKSVGLKKPNELGLYDMSGNVYEWCEDVWQDSYKGAPDDGSAWVEGGDQYVRVVRGGSWNDYDYFCRVSGRYYRLAGNWGDNTGFRIARY